MIGSAIISLAYRLVNKDSTTFLDGNSTNILADLNRCYGHRILDILRVRVDKNASMTSATTDLISTVGLVASNNGYNGEYAFPTTLLKPVRFEVSYDGITWNKCTVYDNVLNAGSEYNAPQINATFSEGEPRVDFNRNSYKVRPLKSTSGNITNGIYIEFEKRQADFTVDSEPTEIEANLHDMLAWDLAKLETVMHSSKYSQTELATFNIEHAKMENRFLEFYSSNLPTRKVMDFNFASLPR